MKTFKEFLTEIITGKLNVGGAATQRHAIRDAPLSKQDHEDAIADLKNAIANNPSWGHLMLPKMKNKLKFHQNELAKLTGRPD